MSTRNANPTPSTDVNNDGMWTVLKTSGDYDSSSTYPIALFSTEKQASDYIVEHEQHRQTILLEEENTTEWSSYAMKFVPYGPPAPHNVHLVHYVETFRWTPDDDREVSSVNIVAMGEKEIMKSPLLREALEHPDRAFQRLSHWDTKREELIYGEVMDSSVFLEVPVASYSGEPIVNFDGEVEIEYDGIRELFVTMDKKAVILSEK